MNFIMWLLSPFILFNNLPQCKHLSILWSSFNFGKFMTVRSYYCHTLSKVSILLCLSDECFSLTTVNALFVNILLHVKHVHFDSLNNECDVLWSAMCDTLKLLLWVYWDSSIKLSSPCYLYTGLKYLSSLLVGIINVFLSDLVGIA